MIDLKKIIKKKRERFNEKEKKCQRWTCVRIARETKRRSEQKAREKGKSEKEKTKKKIKELEKDNSHFFFFFFFACLRPISCSRIFFYKMRVLKRDRIYKIKRETNLREKKIEKIEKLQQISTSYLHTKKKKRN